MASILLRHYSELRQMGMQTRPSCEGRDEKRMTLNLACWRMRPLVGPFDLTGRGRKVWDRAVETRFAR